MEADGWIAPTDEEQRLFEAKRNDDLGSFLTVLAATDVFVPCLLDHADARLAGQQVRGTSLVKTKRWTRTSLDVYTRGLLPAQRPDGVFFDKMMWPALVPWVGKTSPDWTLVVNRGSRIETRLKVGDVALWLKRNQDTVGTWQDLLGTVRTMRSEPQDGDLARALACGAQLAVMGARPWNTMGADRLDYEQTRRTLQKWWSIETAAQWRTQVDRLLDTEQLTSVDRVLSLRPQYAGQSAPSADPTTLTRAVTAWCQQHGTADKARNELLDVAGLVGRCEGWLRRDGLLPHDGVIHTQAAWDLGRAVNMGLWGLAGGFCDRERAEEIVRQAGSACAQTYPNWFSFSAAYVLGRVVQMGRQGSPEQTYQEALDAHNALVRAPSSPWRTLTLR
ncbi:DUF1266 domain-containing protein [Kitasatospora sp. NBC_01266]|uniref:DUF1266 domain-containing protein n=1 Tax=Kitasatospora sp. NBC_01266 TaxID=2903572 RepID=UPI002E34109B|nr:DUF1266 domain-containing protein [Kitasatospora sp. NBC_01266]